MGSANANDQILRVDSTFYFRLIIKGVFEG